MASTSMLPRSVVACRQQPLTYRECSEDLENSHLVACRDSESFARAIAAWSKLASGRHRRRRRRRRGRFFVSFSVFLMKTLQSKLDFFSFKHNQTFCRRPSEPGTYLLVLPAMRPSTVAGRRLLFFSPGARAMKSVPTTRRARESLRQGHDATSPSASATSSTSSSTSSSLPPPPPLSSPFLPFGSTAARQNQDPNSGKIVWVQPLTAEAAQAAAESGVRVLLFDESEVANAADFATLARFDAVVVRFDDGLLSDVTGKSLGVAVDLRTPADVRRAESLSSSSSSKTPEGCDGDENGSEESVVLADARDWTLIPAENLVAAFQEARRRAQASWEAAVRKGGDGDESSPLPKRPKPTPRLLMTAPTSDGALALLGALESGVDGVVLRTGDPRQVRALCAAVLEAAPAEAAARPEKNSGSSSSSNSDDDDTLIEFEVGIVSSVSPAGMGDRVCVDVTVLLEPGEGLLVGSFAAAALLVHSEREGAQGGGSGGAKGEDYISPRPFRVNAGAVHSYVTVPRGRTAYLSELKAGSEVLVVKPPLGGGASTAAATSTAVVGRAKVERRPMLKVDVRLADGLTCSAVLQNAETVRLVAPKSSGAFAPPPPATTAAAAAAKPLPRRRRLGAEDEEALRWAMDPSPPPPLAASAPEKLEADAERTLEWVMGPSSRSRPSSHPLSSPSCDEDGDDSDGAEALVEGPPRRPYLPRNDSRAVAALRWLLGGKRGEEEASSSSSSSEASLSSGFPSWTTVAVTDLLPGQPLLVRRASAARHTGIEVDEWISER